MSSVCKPMLTIARAGLVARTCGGMEATCCNVEVERCKLWRRTQSNVALPTRAQVQRSCFPAFLGLDATRQVIILPHNQSQSQSKHQPCLLLSSPLPNPDPMNFNINCVAITMCTHQPCVLGQIGSISQEVCDKDPCFAFDYSLQCCNGRCPTGVPMPQIMWVSTCWTDVLTCLIYVSLVINMLIFDDFCVGACWRCTLLDVLLKVALETSQNTCAYTHEVRPLQTVTTSLAVSCGFVTSSVAGIEDLPSEPVCVSGLTCLHHSKTFAICWICSACFTGGHRTMQHRHLERLNTPNRKLCQSVVGGTKYSWTRERVHLSTEPTSSASPWSNIRCVSSWCADRQTYHGNFGFDVFYSPIDTLVHVKLVAHHVWDQHDESFIEFCDCAPEGGGHASLTWPDLVHRIVPDEAMPIQPTDVRQVVKFPVSYFKNLHTQKLRNSARNMSGRTRLEEHNTIRLHCDTALDEIGVAIPVWMKFCGPHRCRNAAKLYGDSGRNGAWQQLFFVASWQNTTKKFANHYVLQPFSWQNDIGNRKNFDARLTTRNVFKHTLPFLQLATLVQGRNTCKIKKTGNNITKYTERERRRKNTQKNTTNKARKNKHQTTTKTKHWKQTEQIRKKNKKNTHCTGTHWKKTCKDDTKRNMWEKHGKKQHQLHLYRRENPPFTFKVLDIQNMGAHFQWYRTRRWRKFQEHETFGRDWLLRVTDGKAKTTYR